MTSPFQVFRKNQKILIVAAGVILMIVFTLGDVISGFSGRGGGATNTVVATTVYGAIEENDLAHMMQMRNVLNTFLQQAFQLGIRAGGDVQVYPNLRQPREGDVVQAMLLAKKAEDLGIVVSDQAINQYLKKLTGGKVSPDRLRQLIKNTYVADRGVTMDHIFQALREELLATALLETYELGVVTTPSERWQQFLRLRDQVELELLALPVETFLADVQAPTEAEIAEFYDKHKNRPKQRFSLSGVQVESPDPGFMQPAKAAFQLLKADLDAFIDLAGESITDQQIAEYYDKNKKELAIASPILHVVLLPFSCSSYETKLGLPEYETPTNR